MYPECRHVHPAGSSCNSPALKDSHWCYFHHRLHQRQAARQSSRSHSHRLPNGRFAALPEGVEGQVEAQVQTVDYGPYPVGAPVPATAPARPLELPPIEDAASIQLALIDILQALAANHLDTKRAGLLLYGLQVAAANAKNLQISTYDAVRSVTHTDDGTPLAPQSYGYDVEDYEDEDEDDDTEAGEA